jgi:peptidoglycan/LPS O-acetylase OafA/YrhL
MGYLRFILAISVIASHNGLILGSSFIGGQMAVESFFIISGFYMALILNKKYLDIKHPYKTFIINRFLRIYPTYWIVLLLSVLLSLYWLHLGMDNYFNTYVAYARQINLFSLLFLIFSHITIFGQDLVLFVGLNTHSGNLFLTNNFLQTNPPLFTFMFIPQAWTLALEFMFYLLAPFLVRKSSKILVLVIFLSLLLRIILYMNGLNHEPWTYRFFPTEIIFFIFGIFSYRIFSAIKKKHINKEVFIIIYAVTFIYTFFYSHLPLLGLGWFNITQWVYYLALIVFIPFIFLFSQKSKFSNFVGEFSYPIYISHLLISIVLINFKIIKFNNPYFSLMSAVVSILFSYVLLKLIIYPIDKFRQRRVMNALPVNIKKTIDKN